MHCGAQQASVNIPVLFNTECSLMPVIAYLAAGGAGIDAATHIVVRKAWTQMLLVYAAVPLLCFITFRSWREVAVVAVLPLVVTSSL